MSILCKSWHDKLARINKLTDAQKEHLFFNADSFGISPGHVLAASNLPPKVLEYVLEKGSCNQQLCLASNKYIGNDLLQRLAATSQFEIVRWAAGRKLQYFSLINLDSKTAVGH